LNPWLLLAVTAPKAIPSALATTLPKGALPSTAPVAMPPSQPPPVNPIAQHVPWLTHGLAGLFVIASLLLIFLLAVQTTKQEGLTGSIGGRVESSYRGRLGAEEQLKRWTGIVAVAFVVTGFVLSLTGI
jgi:protein translocase SecG subunit